MACYSALWVIEGASVHYTGVATLAQVCATGLDAEHAKCAIDDLCKAGVVVQVDGGWQREPFGAVNPHAAEVLGRIVRQAKTEPKWLDAVTIAEQSSLCVTDVVLALTALHDTGLIDENDGMYAVRR